MAEFVSDEAAIYQRPIELLQNLIRFDTTNPPGKEAECIRYIDSLLTGAGIQTSILALDPVRPNLIARLPGEGKAPPLLLYGHVDVVTTEGQQWQHPPFEGSVIDGYVWGRGTLDMKGGLATMLAAFLRAKAESLTPPGEIILAMVTDEEQAGKYGARYLVENHKDQFKGVRYAIGEFGAFRFYLGKKRLYPIMVAEKQPCTIEVTLRGPGGHPTATFHAGAMARLGEVLQRIETRHLPVHITTATRQMIQAISSSLTFPSNLVIQQLLNPRFTDGILKLLGKQVEQFEAVLHNTVNATAIFGAEDSFKIPSAIGLRLVCNLLPGYNPDDAVAELRTIIGAEHDIKVIDTRWCEPVTTEPDMGLFETLAEILREVDPECVPCPLVFPGPTDGRLFSKLGIQTYGFIPMNLPEGFVFWQLAHAADERIPADAVVFGAEAIYKVLQRFS